MNGDNKSESNGQADSSSNNLANDQAKNEPTKIETVEATVTQPLSQQNTAPPMNVPMQNQGPPTQMQNFNTPPPFAGFGMPPPNYMYPPNPWSMPWQQPMPQQMANDKSRNIDPQVSSNPRDFQCSTQLIVAFSTDHGQSSRME